MSEILLQTKLFIPPLRPSLVPRPRLLRRLNAGAGTRLILVSAPAGFGKTTLITHWLQEQDRPAAWLSLDENDNAPQRFFAYFLAAVQTVYPQVAQRLAAALRSSRPPDERSVMPTLINELSAGALPLLFVLDDYHLIDSQTIHEVISFFVDHMPPQICLVLTSREDPPLPLPRWRVRGQLVEIRAPDLRFTTGEGLAFLEGTMGLHLAGTAVDELTARTEGWVAALQLAALSIGSGEDAEPFIKGFAGSNRQIADYLLQEVLLQQPAAVQQFLLRTSLLERFSSGLCDYLLESENSQAMLETLDMANLFLIPLDDQRNWYRYHHLFGQLLRYRLARQMAETAVAGLHRRAAQWYEAQDLLEEAIGHALQIPDFAHMAQLVASIPSHTMYEQGWAGLVKKWAGLLPPEIIRQYPYTAILAVGAHLITGDVSRVQHYLALIADDETTQPEQALFHSILVRNIEADNEQALRLAHQALHGLPEDDINMRSVARLQIAVNHFNMGQIAEAERSIVDIRRSLRADDPSMLSMLLQVIHMQAVSALVRADNYQAERLCREGIDLAEKQDDQSGLPFAGLLYARLANIHYEWNEMEQAAARLAVALDWARLTGISDILFEASEVRAELAAWRGDKQTVYEVIDRIATFADQSGMDNVLKQTEVVAASYYLRLGELDKAVRWANASGYHLHDEPHYRQIPAYRTLAAVYLAESRALNEKQMAAGVIELVDKLLALLKDGQHRYRLIDCLALKALALAWQGPKAEALVPLQAALEMAKPGSLMRVFLDWGEPMQALLAKAIDLQPVYAGRLLQAFTKEPSAAVSQATSPALHLTQRESEILGLIAAGHSNKEIETQLFISKNTVRTHIKNLYSKLGVKSRTQAVQQATERHLI